ncbi:1-carboxy-3-chloro-3,4-dihydroxycyclo hexa-1,5-diene dehydrogenase [Acidocella aquatica]|uniref:1-carboxy-3-chloro-3,4-dihydroxycyclo hexa-1,5-diene dehydrogenase n=1 Tax=Acidocella aquatica TaxID=1922313 RepID=A0ABQ6A3U9_9PROT|nr:Gfo/Idh/MocA family oxidoreductase [Acidocella aquatica]GLR67165.1 1-carboxy-3-chloro-3,4-dihydroxycyclo hexa-1,5-diene dehydrogenase [Acidocella aquatica]
MREIGIGLIGTGFMGKTHAIAYRAASSIFPDCPRSILRAVSDINIPAAEAMAAQFGFQRWSADWHSLLDDPSIEVISITTPNVMHREMALAAIAAGKHVHCEKPIAPNAADAHAMMEAAQAAGCVTQVGYNYIKNPLLKLAREMVSAGELGEITGFRGIHAEDYMADSQVPYNWRVDPSGGGGAVADLGSHIAGMARFLLGPISAVNADLETVIKTRPVAAGASERRDVLVDDIARLTVRFARGCGGTIEANWVATGRKMQLGFELTGSKGSLIFTQERLNEMLHYRSAASARNSGFVRIETGPAHPPYGLFCVAPGHQLGFNDLKTIEMAEFLSAINGGEHQGPDFREAWEIQKVIDAAIASSAAKSWIDIT